MKPLPQLIILDRDGLICANSRDPDSLFYRIKSPDDFILKPNVQTAFELLFCSDIPFVIVTKQRGLKDGTISEDAFAKIWLRMNALLVPKRFGHMELPAPYVEMEREDKTEQFRTILTRNPHISAGEVVVIDDSARECEAARSLGMQAIQTGDLYTAVCSVLSVEP